MDFDWTLFSALVGGSAAAIAVIALLLHLLGLSRTLTAASEAEAIGFFREDVPAPAPVEAALSEKGDMALLRFEETPAIGVLAAMGVHWMTKLIGPGEVARVTRTRKGALRVTLHDFTEPLVVISLRDGTQAPRWAARLEALIPDRERTHRP